VSKDLCPFVVSGIGLVLPIKKSAVYASAEYMWFFYKKTREVKRSGSMTQEPPPYLNRIVDSIVNMNNRSPEDKPFLEQLTEFIDVVGKHGVGVTMVALCLLFVLFMHHESNSWQNIVAYIVAIPAIIFGAYIEYRKLEVELKERLFKIKGGSE
jgi:hypothetical protein